MADPKDFHDYVLRLWNEASDEVKEVYGWDYLKAYLDLDDFATDEDLEPVISAITDALFSLKPSRSYTMGAGSFLVPFMNYFCPTLLTRSATLMEKYTFYVRTKPKALQKE